MAPLARSDPFGIQVLSDDGDAKIREPCMRGVVNNVHKHVLLMGRQGGGKERFRITTYSFEISVDHIAGVKIMEALSDPGQLVTGMNNTGEIVTGATLTSPNRFASGYIFKYSDRSPASIRGEISWGGEMVVPRRGKIF